MRHPYRSLVGVEAPDLPRDDDDRHLRIALGVLIVLGLARLLFAAVEREWLSQESAFGVVTALGCLAALMVLRAERSAGGRRGVSRS